MQRGLTTYDRNARWLTSHYLALQASPATSPVSRWWPHAPARVLDIGAGPGRDARWFARQGHCVTAVEPVADFRSAGARLCGPSVRWVNAALPHLPDGPPADLLWVRGVWQHIPPAQHWATFRAFRCSVRRGGVLIMALRDGPSPRDRSDVPLDPLRLFQMATRHGFKLRTRCVRPSLGNWNRQNGVRWIWAVWSRVG